MVITETRINFQNAHANGHSLVGKFILFHFGLAQLPWYVNSIWCIYPTHLVHVAHNHTNKINVV